MTRRASAYEDAVYRAAEQELSWIEARLARMKPGEVATNPVLAHEYQSLIEERGRLRLLLARKGS